MNIFERLRDKDSMPVMLAPMAGITDIAFREICVEHSCDFTYTEMVSAKGLFYESEKSHELIRTSEKERPCGVQLFGSDPEIISKMARNISQTHGEELALIDINMGCPAPKIVSNGEGSALMRDIMLASRIVSEAVKASSVPITIKIRKGWDDEHINAVAFAKMAEECGASAITVHGRTRMEFFSGNVDLDIIKKVKESVSIPVIGNGDITSGESAIHMVKYTNCDGIMIARGAQGNPWIFEQVKAAFENRQYISPNSEEKLRVMLDHASRIVKNKGEHGIVEMRKHISWYTKGMRDAAQLRVKANTLNTLDEVRELFENVIKNGENSNIS